MGTDRWRRAGAVAGDTAYIGWALGEAPTPLRVAVEQALARPGTWYALRYKVAPAAAPGDTPHVLNVDLFVVDLGARELFAVNFNT